MTPRAAAAEILDSATLIHELIIPAATELRITPQKELGLIMVRLRREPAVGSRINLEVWLPEMEKWNGRFLGLENAGAAGEISPEPLAGASTVGHAAASADLGTAPDVSAGIEKPEVWQDLGYRATDLMTVAAKQIVQAYYGRAPTFSYFSGGSTGGQQGMQEVQRYPKDYDGVAVVMPAHCHTPLHAYFLWNHQIRAKCPFTKTQEAAVIAAANALAAASELPWAAGKFVSGPRHTPADVERVIAHAQRIDPTLTVTHAAALRQLFDGPRHAITGERIFSGIAIGASLEAS